MYEFRQAYAIFTDADNERFATSEMIPDELMVLEKN